MSINTDVTHFPERKKKEMGIINAMDWWQSWAPVNFPDVWELRAIAATFIILVLIISKENRRAGSGNNHHRH